MLIKSMVILSVPITFFMKSYLRYAFSSFTVITSKSVSANDLNNSLVIEDNIDDF